MKCPRCKFENPPHSDVCGNCGLKFKIKCPECSTMNKIGTPLCTNCGAVLIRFCPDCGAANSPSSINCRKCGYVLLKKCPDCSALNPVDSEICLKCEASFEKKVAQSVISDEEVKQEPAEEKEEVLEESKSSKEIPALFVELSNYESLKEQISNEVFFNKLLRRFYQTVIKIVQDTSAKILKIKPNLLAVEFNSSESDISEDIAAAVYLSEELFNAFSDLNNLLQKKSDIIFNIKEVILTREQIEENVLLEMFSKLQTDSFYIDKKSFEISSSLFVDVNFLPFDDDFMLVIPSGGEQDEPPAEVEEEVVDIVEDADKKPKMTREEVVKLLVEKISYQDNCRFISLQGVEGVGKSAILNLIIQSAAGEKNLIIFSECCDLFLQKPYGLFQDILKTLIGIPLMNMHRDAVAKTIDSLFTSGQVFCTLSEGTKNVLKDFILPPVFDADDFSVIDSSTTKKDQIYLAFEELFGVMKSSMRLVVIIEDIEYIDDSSLELLEYLIDNGFLNNKAILVATQSSTIPSEIIVNSSNLTVDNTISVQMPPLNEQEAMTCVDGFTAQKPLVSLDFKEKIFNKSKGLPLYIQNLMLYFMQVNLIESVGPSDFNINPDIYAFELPDKTEDLLILRLDDIFKKYKNSYKIMCYAALFGYIFPLKIIKEAAGIDEAELKSIMEVFIRNQLVATFDGRVFFFKNKMIMNVVKNNMMKEGFDSEISFDLLQVAKNALYGEAFYCATLARRANQNQEAFVLFAKATKEALFCGDINLYLKAQKNLLKLFDFAPFADKEDRKKQLCIELGRANYINCPQDAVEFLTEALQLISSDEMTGNTTEILDILGYLSKSFILCGNYQGAIQAIDQSIRYINPERMRLEYALLCYLKMKILMNIGSIGEVIDLCNNTILPIIDDCISKKITISQMSMSELRHTKSDIMLTLARAYAVQGNPHYEKVIAAADIDDAIMTKSNVEAFITSAIYKTLQGDIVSSEELLHKADSIADSIGASGNTTLLWAFLKLLNKSFLGEFDSAEQEILILSQKAKKLNNSLIYNFTTLLMARYFREIKQYDKAKSIINDRVNYFSQQKISSGALLCWYLIGCIFLEEKNVDDAMSIARQALEVCQKTGINNIYFAACFEKLMADCYISRHDFEMVNIHLEKAMKLSKANNLMFMQCRIYSLMGKAYYEIATTMADSKKENAQNSYEMYKIALNIALGLKNEYVAKQINLDISTLKAYCNLQNLSLEEKTQQEQSPA